MFLDEAMVVASIVIPIQWLSTVCKQVEPISISKIVAACTSSVLVETSMVIIQTRDHHTILEVKIRHSTAFSKKEETTPLTTDLTVFKWLRVALIQSKHQEAEEWTSHLLPTRSVASRTTAFTMEVRQTTIRTLAIWIAPTKTYHLVMYFQNVSKLIEFQLINSICSCIENDRYSNFGDSFHGGLGMKMRGQGSN